MNSLEDAFVNITTNEEMFTNPEIFMKRSRKELRRESKAVPPASVKSSSANFKYVV